MREMHFKEDGIKAWGVMFLIRGASPLSEDWRILGDISSTSFILASDEREALDVASERMEKVLGMPCDEAGLKIRVFDIVASWHELDEKYEEAHMVVDDIIQMAYQLAGGEDAPDNVMGFLERCDDRLGIRSRNYENPCMKSRIEKILENKGEE